MNSLRRKGLLLGLFTLVVSALVLAISQAGAFQGQTRTFEPSLTEEEVLRDLPQIAEARAAGTPVYIAPGPTPDPLAVPRVSGPFRIVPAGFVGSLTSVPVEPPADLGVATDDLDEILRSALWATPTDVPAGYTLDRADTFDGVQTSNVALRAFYVNADGDEIIFYRRRVAELPIDYHVDLNSPVLSFEEIELPDGSPGVALRPTSLSTQRKGGLPDEVLIAPEKAYKYVATFDSTDNIITAIETFGAPDISVEILATMLASVK